ncbi:hypothetical protein Bbelb_266340 [Branchiostoma belcheri]|nr:hypothetical protein Bbelb_266340 [Branchiostoma belcheri]
MALGRLSPGGPEPPGFTSGFTNNRERFSAMAFCGRGAPRPDLGLCERPRAPRTHRKTISSRSFAVRLVKRAMRRGITLGTSREILAQLDVNLRDLGAEGHRVTDTLAVDLVVTYAFLTAWHTGAYVGLDAVPTQDVTAPRPVRRVAVTQGGRVTNGPGRHGMSRFRSGELGQLRETNGSEMEIAWIPDSFSSKAKMAWTMGPPSKEQRKGLGFSKTLEGEAYRPRRVGGKTVQVFLSHLVSRHHTRHGTGVVGSSTCHTATDRYRQTTTRLYWGSLISSTKLVTTKSGLLTTAKRGRGQIEIDQSQAPFYEIQGRRPGEVARTTGHFSRIEPLSYGDYLRQKAPGSRANGGDRCCLGMGAREIGLRYKETISPPTSPESMRPALLTGLNLTPTSTQLSGPVVSTFLQRLASTVLK